ncbi:MAG TPA: cell division protein ZapE [Bauldia sp.]|nr:cell division protein ZapE [Bauldia sp.]
MASSGGTGTIAAHYRALVAAGELSADPAQSALADRLDRLNAALAESRLARKTSSLGWLFAARHVPRPRGLYLYGAVGRGKTMLMDAFFAAARPQRKRRIHFNEFMANVHDRIHAWRQAGHDGDPIAPVARAIAGEIRLLCLDEFAVEDIADAMILARLFGGLFAEGVVLVATSNTAPDDLYRNGLNRPLFLPFIAVLKENVDVVELSARTDYRLEKLGKAEVYVTPLGPAADAALDRLWLDLTGTVRGQPATLAVKGRTVPVPQAARGAARFSFDDLCARPLGAADYLELAGTYATVFVDHVPALRDDERDKARRFINLVDTLYDGGRRLVVSAATEPEGIYRAKSGEEAFAFRRTVSRLAEMRSEEWLKRPQPAVRRAD